MHRIAYVHGLLTDHTVVIIFVDEVLTSILDGLRDRWVVELLFIKAMHGLAEVVLELCVQFKLIFDVEALRAALLCLCPETLLL